MSQAATATTAVTISPAAPAPPSSAEAAHPSRQSYAVELYFDPALENQVLKAWNVLARRQISTQLIEIASRPHITLLSSSSLDPTRILPALRSLASRLEPLPLSLSSIASLPNSGVGGALFLAPTPTSALLSLHAQMCETLRKEGVDASEDFRPDSWVPQCHVAVDVPRSRLGEAFCILRDLKLPVSGYAMDIGLVEFSPAEGSFSEIFSEPLGGEAEA